MTWLSWSGCRNTRDLGGLPTRDGLGVRPRKTRKAIADAVQRVLEDDSYRRAAMDMREHIVADARADRLTTELMALPTLTYAHDAQRHRGGERAEARA